MRWITVLFLLFSMHGFSQWKDYKLAANGDTLNRVDVQGLKQKEWKIRYEFIRGEPGFEEEGVFLNNRKEGAWRIYNLMGDLVGIENYHWGNKDGISQYFTTQGELRLEQSWKALNPDKLYDTIDVEDVDKLESYRQVVIKNEGVSLKHGTWKYFDGPSGAVVKTETYVLGRLDESGKSSAATSPEKKPMAKPKEVVEFEKKYSGKKKVKYKDGTTGAP